MLSPKLSAKRGLGLALAWWLAVGVEVGAVGHTPGLAVPDAFGFTFTGAGVAVHLALVTVVSAVVAWAQFRGARPTARQAIAAALTVVAVSIVLDAAITVPFAVKSYSHYFGKVTLWAGLAWAAAVLTAVALRPRPAPRGARLESAAR